MILRIWKLFLFYLKGSPGRPALIAPHGAVNTGHADGASGIGRPGHPFKLPFNSYYARALRNVPIQNKTILCFICTLFSNDQ